MFLHFEHDLNIACQVINLGNFSYVIVIKHEKGMMDNMSESEVMTT